MTSTRSFCTFRLGSTLFGVAVERVQEVLRDQRVARVPLAPPMVRGLINLRGQIVTAIDLRRRLGRTDPAPLAPPMNVVLRTPQGAFSLVVDSLGDVVEVAEERLEPPPSSLEGPGSEVIRSVVQLPEQLLLVLDVDRTVGAPGA